MLSSSSNIGVRKMVYDSLGLLSSYLSGETVKLEALPFGYLHNRQIFDDETQNFLDYLIARHTIACGYTLKSILSKIENRISTFSNINREISKGILGGRIDIPLYVKLKSQRKFPREYPILGKKDVPETPENILVTQVLRNIAYELGKIYLPKSTAEGQAINYLYNWCIAKLHRWPWDLITKREQINYLVGQTEQRIRKHQTGNELSYKSFLEWIIEWGFDINNLDVHGKTRLVNGLLAFPVDDSFQNKIFEIWCLREVANSLISCGCQLITGPVSLQHRNIGPIYELQWNSERIKIWFQNSNILGRPRWNYLEGTNLSGIPDIIVHRENYSPMIIDAKYRVIITPTRSEETYKILGYIENFREVIGVNSQSILFFISGEQLQERYLVSQDNNKLAIFSIDSLISKIDIFQNSLQALISGWLLHNSNSSSHHN